MTDELKIRKIDCASADAAAAIQEIRRQLSPRGDVVSPKGKQLTLEVFGEALTPRAVVERICDDVARRGLDALLEYSHKLDRAQLTRETLRVSEAELRAAHQAAAPEFLEAIRKVRHNVRVFQSAILHQDAIMPMSDHELRLLYRPLRRVGFCIPGGSAAYPSTVLMTVVPALAAGVKECVVIAPPTPFGANNPDLLATCHEIGVKEVYRMGGAQGVAALAYGVEGVEPVDKIVGPGNLFVALAKARVSEFVGIDMLAGPTEVVVLADETANPKFVAADLISQAEHSPGASILITWSPALAEQVERALLEQLAEVERSKQSRDSLEAYGAILMVANEAEGCRLSNVIAPEHLQIETRDPDATFSRIENAGAVFLGHFTPVAVGDYVAGPSHTLPTGGTARFASGLTSNDFLKRISVIEYSPTKLRAAADPLRVIANKEGLTAHARSVDIRLAAIDDGGTGRRSSRVRVY
ncbi:MAG: histidinol dehydrogenase [Planctomycetota bacterium]